MNRSVFYSIIIFQVILLIVVLFMLNNKPIDNKYLDIAELKHPNFYKAVTLQKKFSNLEFPNEFYNSDESRDINLPILIVRFSEFYCNACINRDVEILKRLSSDIGFENMIYLVSHNRNYYWKRFKEIKKIKSGFYNVSFDYLDIDRDSLTTPYMFILDQDSTIKSLFISIKEDEARTIEYLESIKKNFID